MMHAVTAINCWMRWNPTLIIWFQFRVLGQWKQVCCKERIAEILANLMNYLAYESSQE